MLLGILESLKQAKHLINITSQREVIDGLLLDDAVFVDQERAAKRDAGFRDQDVVIAGDRLMDVGHDGVGDAFDAAFGFGGVKPGHVRELAVNRDANDLAIVLFERFPFILDRVQLSRSNECEIKWVEEHDDIFAVEVA